MEGRTLGKHKDRIRERRVSRACHTLYIELVETFYACRAIFQKNVLDLHPWGMSDTAKAEFGL